MASAAALLLALAACDGGTDPNTPPTATIEEPSDGAVFREGEEITFRGTATDPEEGALAGDALEWRSDRDGRLGTGRVVTTTLSLGTHEVVLTATDAAGDTGADTVDVTIEAAASLECAAGQGREVSLAQGEHLLVRSPADFCLRFGATAADEAYLIGVQSATEVAGSLTPVRIRADAAGQAEPAAGIGGSAASEEAAAEGGGGEGAGVRAPDLRSLLDPGALRRERHREVEARIRRWERERLGDLPAGGGAVEPPSRDGLLDPYRVPAGLGVGDVIELRVPDLVEGEDLCSDFVTVDAEVALVGQRSVWLLDQENPPSGLRNEDLRELSDRFDQVIFEVDSDWFGTPTDIDDNGRIAILLTKEVNRSPNLLGFVFSGDLLPRSRCTQSSEGEIYYGKAPDPNGTFGDPYPVENMLEDAPHLLAHEFVHVIQFGRRIHGGATTLQSIWMAEGQATFAEEVVGYAFTGLGPRQNHGFEVAFNDPPRFEIDWFSNAFVDMALYFGFESQQRRIAEAPHECTWLDLPDPDPESEVDLGPCIGNRQVYGVPWSLLRWISDHFGPGFPGGARGIHRALVDNGDAAGFENVEEVLGVEMEDLLAEWAPMLYVDDRVGGLEPRLTFPSWNLFDIYERNLVETAELQPIRRTFSDFTLDLEVRGGSSAYLRLAGADRSRTTVAVSDLAGTPLPGRMQVWVVRLR